MKVNISQTMLGSKYALGDGFFIRFADDFDTIFSMYIREIYTMINYS